MQKFLHSSPRSPVAVSVLPPLPALSFLPFQSKSRAPRHPRADTAALAAQPAFSELPFSPVGSLKAAELEPSLPVQPMTIVYPASSPRRRTSRSSHIPCPAAELHTESVGSEAASREVGGCSNLQLSPSRDCRDFLSSGHGKEIWIFGYGSVIWKPGFEYAHKVEGYIKGFRRVFHQGSTDHRGTPNHPGRTATLESAANCVTWGTAFRLAGSFEEQLETLQYLEWREAQYDLRVHLDVYGSNSEKPIICNALTYIATPNQAANTNWLGEAPCDSIARQIALARGPSGPNSEYLCNLADAMLQMGVEDLELQLLASKVRAMQAMPEVQEAARKRLSIEPVPIMCSHIRACMERHRSAESQLQAIL